MFPCEHICNKASTKATNKKGDTAKINSAHAQVCLDVQWTTGRVAEFSVQMDLESSTQPPRRAKYPRGQSPAKLTSFLVD